MGVHFATPPIDSTNKVSHTAKAGIDKVVCRHIASGTMMAVHHDVRIQVDARRRIRKSCERDEAGGWNTRKLPLVSFADIDDSDRLARVQEARELDRRNDPRPNCRLAC